MKRWMVQGLLALDAWHRVMLHRSTGYQKACQVLAHYLTTGYWDLDPRRDDIPHY